jgi:hypothetical protein
MLFISGLSIIGLSSIVVLLAGANAHRILYRQDIELVISYLSSRCHCSDDIWRSDDSFIEEGYFATLVLSSGPIFPSPTCYRIKDSAHSFAKTARNVG